MMKPLFAASVAGILTLLALRAAILPSQLKQTPYNDDTLAVDFLRVLFQQVPGWVYGASIVVFVLVLLVFKIKSRRVNKT